MQNNSAEHVQTDSVEEGATAEVLQHSHNLTVYSDGRNVFEKELWSQAQQLVFESGNTTNTHKSQMQRQEAVSFLRRTPPNGRVR